jgi:transcription elongation factor Elf1
MTEYTKKNGIFLPQEKPKKQSPVYLDKFDCPHCGVYFDASTQGGEVYTVGNVGPGPHIPHMHCPECKKCMGCRD